MTREQIKDILKLITYTIVLIFLLFNLDFTINIIKAIFRLILPFIIGIAIAFILNVLLVKIEKRYKKIFKKKKANRIICLTITFSIVILIIFLIYKLVVPQVIDSIELISNNLNNYINTISICLNDIGISNDNIKEFSNYIISSKDEILKYINVSNTKVITFVLDTLTSVIGIIVNLAIGIVFAIYLLLQKEKLLIQTKRTLNAYLPKEKVESITEIAKLSNKVFSNFIGGQLTEAIILGLLCFTGMLILKIPYATIISVIITITALIPMVGALIGTAIGALFILVTQPLKTITFIIFIIILQQIEGNFIYPKVVGKTVGLPGIWVVVAITIGASLWGLIGMIISVPITSIIYSLITNNVNKRLKYK